MIFEIIIRYFIAPHIGTQHSRYICTKERGAGEFFFVCTSSRRYRQSSKNQHRREKEEKDIIPWLDFLQRVCRKVRIRRKWEE